MPNKIASACFSAFCLLPLLTFSWVSNQSCQAANADQDSLRQSAYKKADWVFDHATETHYEHVHKPAAEQVKLVSATTCEADADCSGFVSYVLGEIAPRQYEQICAAQPNKSYPLAKTYTKFFLSLPDDEKGKGWRRVGKIEDLKQGDMIAWAKPVDPDATKKGNTGHVMIVAEAPGAPDSETVDEQKVRFISVKVIDCSSIAHFKPEILPPHAQQDHRDGLGKGVVRLIVDESSQPIGYWEGTFSNISQNKIKHPTYTTDIGFARLVSQEQ